MRNLFKKSHITICNVIHLSFTTCVFYCIYINFYETVNEKLLILKS